MASWPPTKDSGFPLDADYRFSIRSDLRAAQGLGQNLSLRLLDYIDALEAERDALREIAERIVDQPWNHIRHGDLLELRQLLERPE